ncbi:hypothetical protein M3J09_004635 [Ascochyta lentis]
MKGGLRDYGNELRQRDCATNPPKSLQQEG